MNINRPLMPGFLKKAEQKLLLNKPGIWSTRAHLVAYYGLLFIIALAAICFLDPSDVRSRSTTEYWIGFVIVISIIGLVVWLIYLLRFNLFKKYGLLHPLFPLASFILYFISAGIIVLFPYVQPAVESYRANRAYGDEELVKDINSINTKICQLEYNSLKLHWDHDTVSLINPGDNVAESSYTAAAGTVDTSEARRYQHYRLDSASFNYRINNADSLLKINDSLYILYKTPDYAFVDLREADMFTKQKVFSAFELYNKLLKYPQPPINRAGIMKELEVLLNKYNYREDKQSLYSYDVAENTGADDDIFYKIEKKYALTNVRASIGHIVSKKYRWERGNLATSMRVFYYVTLVISLLVFVFRHTTVRTFFLSLLTGVLLTILTAFIIAFMRPGDAGSLLWLIVYTVIFFIGSLLVWVNQKRTAITGIFINLFVMLVPLFPLLLFSYYYAWKQQQYWQQQKELIMPDHDLYALYAEIGGALLLLVLLAAYIGKLYCRWYSLPED